MADNKQLNQEAQELKEQKDKDFDKQNKKPTDDQEEEEEEEEEAIDSKENETEPKKEGGKPGESCCR